MRANFNIHDQIKNYGCNKLLVYLNYFKDRQKCN